MNTLIDRRKIYWNTDFTKKKLAKFQTGGAYRGGAYKKKRVIQLKVFFVIVLLMV